MASQTRQQLICILNESEGPIVKWLPFLTVSFGDDSFSRAECSFKRISRRSWNSAAEFNRVKVYWEDSRSWEVEEKAECSLSLERFMPRCHQSIYGLVVRTLPVYIDSCPLQSMFDRSSRRSQIASLALAHFLQLFPWKIFKIYKKKIHFDPKEGRDFWINKVLRVAAVMENWGSVLSSPQDDQGRKDWGTCYHPPLQSASLTHQLFPIS